MLWFNCKEDILKHTNFNMSCFSSRKNTLQCVKQPHWCWLKPKVDIHVRGPFRMTYFLIISTFRPMSSQLCYVSHAAARMGGNAMQCMNISAGSHAMGAMLSLLSCTVLGLGAAAFQLQGTWETSPLFNCILGKKCKHFHLYFHFLLLH